MKATIAAKDVEETSIYDITAVHHVETSYGWTEKEAAMNGYKLARKRLDAVEKMLKERGLWMED